MTEAPVIGLPARNPAPSRAATSHRLRTLSRLGTRCGAGDPIGAASGAGENMIGTRDSRSRTQHLAEQVELGAAQALAGGRGGTDRAVIFEQQIVLALAPPFRHVALAAADGGQASDALRQSGGSREG